MRLSKSAILAYVLLIFASGMAVGWGVFRLYTVRSVNANTVHNPEEWRRHYVSEMQTRLRLQSDQVGKLNSILDETRARFTQAKERMRPELEGIRAEQTGKVRAMLSDSQRQEFEKMRQEHEQREKAHGRLPGPGMSWRRGGRRTRRACPGIAGRMVDPSSTGSRARRSVSRRWLSPAHSLPLRRPRQ